MADKPIYVSEKIIAQLLSISTKKLQKDRSQGVGLKTWIKIGRNVRYHQENSIKESGEGRA